MFVDTTEAGKLIAEKRHPSLKAGQALSVTGTFDTAKDVGRYVFHDELDADEGSIQ
jgi:hypothetical protein